MARYLLGRLVGIAFVLVVVSIVIFFLMHAIPGGPFDEEKMPLPPAAKENFLRKYGLDQPVYVQYFRYVSNALRGDFGIPFQSPTETVGELIARTWPVSIQLGLVTLAIAIPLGLLLGIAAAQRQNSWVDYLATGIATFGLTIPNFVVAIWLVLLLPPLVNGILGTNWLPTGGWGAPKNYIMPVIALGLAPMALAARYTRASVLEVKRADFIRTAKAKGLGPRRILWRHTMRNSLIPLVTVLGPQIPNLITGTIFIETIFRIPGLGKFFVTSIFRRDYPMIMATLLLVALLWSLVYLLTDILYTVIDPRVRLDKKNA
jgi:ABC-type dipeptide/oligopeptide/nickel transport system permease component